MLHNGSRITGSTWLRNGDVLDAGAGRLKLRVEGGRRVLEVVAGGHGNVTAPPVAPESSSLSGAGADEGERIEPVAFRPQTVPGASNGRRWPTRRIAVVLAGLALAAVAALIFTSTPVQVEIDPAPQRVAFEGGWPGLQLGSSHLLRPGKYTLVAEREGYAVLRAPVMVERERGEVLRYHLTPLPGRLRIVTPVPGSVSIDGQQAGKAPGEFQLPAGTHKLLIDTERYVDYAADVRVEGFGKLQTLAPKLTPGWSKVTVETDPVAARVFVAGKDRGDDATLARSRRRVIPARAAARWLQAMGYRRAGEGQRAAADRSGETRPARRAPGGAQSPDGCERHDRWRLPRPHAARAGRKARPAAGGQRDARGLRACDARACGRGGQELPW